MPRDRSASPGASRRCRSRSRSRSPDRVKAEPPKAHSLVNDAKTSGPAAATAAPITVVTEGSIACDGCYGLGQTNGRKCRWCKGKGQTAAGVHMCTGCGDHASMWAENMKLRDPMFPSRDRTMCVDCQKAKISYCDACCQPDRAGVEYGVCARCRKV